MTSRSQASRSYLRPEGCICIYFRDTGGFRIADLTCTVHGVNGSDPGDGYWEEAPSCDLESVTLSVTFCREHPDQVLISTVDHRDEFTSTEIETITKLGDLFGSHIRWQRNSIPDHAHVHIDTGLPAPY